MQSNTPTTTIIQERLTQALQPITLELQDNSAQHVGHAGAQSGGGHYSLLIVSEAFTGKSPVARHQMIYGALDGLIGGAIHALSITAKTPAEHQ
jgi:BolA protein